MVKCWLFSYIWQHTLTPYCENPPPLHWQPHPLTHQNASTSRISSIKNIISIPHPLQPPTRWERVLTMPRPWASGLVSWVSRPTAYIQVSSSYHKILARYTRAYQQGFPYGKFGGESHKKKTPVHSGWGGGGGVMAHRSISPPQQRGPAEIGRYRQNIGRYRKISANIGRYRQISANIGSYRQYRRISTDIGWRSRSKWADPHTFI